MRALFLSAEAGGQRAGRRRCFSPQLPFARFQIPPSLKPRPEAPTRPVFAFQPLFRPILAPASFNSFRERPLRRWAGSIRSSHSKPKRERARACRFLNKTNCGAPSAWEACLVFDGAPGFHRAKKKRMANCHSLTQLFLLAPRRSQPISSKTGQTAPPASRHSQRKRLQVAPAQQPTRRLRRKYFRRGPPSASKGERKQGTGQETAREKRECGMGDGEEGRKKGDNSRNAPPRSSKPAAEAQRLRQGFGNARDASAPVAQKKWPSGARRRRPFISQL